MLDGQLLTKSNNYTLQFIPSYKKVNSPDLLFFPSVVTTISLAIPEPAGVVHFRDLPSSEAYVIVHIASPTVTLVEPAKLNPALSMRIYPMNHKKYKIPVIFSSVLPIVGPDSGVTLVTCGPKKKLLKLTTSLLSLTYWA